MATLAGLKLAQTVGQVPGIDESRVSGSSGLTTWTYFTGSEGRVESLYHLWLIEVGEIQASTNPEQWRYMPTKLSLSVLVTRGLRVSALAEDKWWSGPAFLKQDPA